MKFVTSVICFSLVVVVALAQNECPTELREKFLISREECLNGTLLAPITTTTTTAAPTDVDEQTIDDIENTESETIPEVPAQIVDTDNDDADNDDTTTAHVHGHRHSSGHSCRSGRRHRHRHNSFGIVGAHQYKRCLVDKIQNEPGVAEIQAECQATVANIDAAYRQFKTDVCLLRRVKRNCNITVHRQSLFRNRRGPARRSRRGGMRG